MGQRSFFEDPYKVALRYAKQFESNGKIKDKPGIEFADKLNEEFIG